VLRNHNEKRVSRTKDTPLHVKPVCRRAIFITCKIITSSEEGPGFRDPVGHQGYQNAMFLRGIHRASGLTFPKATI
jgi:hypothetical protein